jgi:hypothetical protein
MLNDRYDLVNLTEGGESKTQLYDDMDEDEKPIKNTSSS